MSSGLKEKRKFQTNTETGRNHKTIYFTFKEVFDCILLSIHSVELPAFVRKLLP